jgi:hypothetical protein
LQWPELGTRNVEQLKVELVWKDDTTNSAMTSKPQPAAATAAVLGVRDGGTASAATSASTSSSTAATAAAAVVAPATASTTNTNTTHGGTHSSAATSQSATAVATTPAISELSKSIDALQREAAQLRQQLADAKSELLELVRVWVQ